MRMWQAGTNCDFLSKNYATSISGAPESGHLFSPIEYPTDREGQKALPVILPGVLTQSIGCLQSNHCARRSLSGANRDRSEGWIVSSIACHRSSQPLIVSEFAQWFHSELLQAVVVGFHRFLGCNLMIHDSTQHFDESKRMF